MQKHLALFVVSFIFLAPKASATNPLHSKIHLKCTANTGNFARYVPFKDGREVIVRSGKEKGFHYGEQISKTPETISGKTVWLADMRYNFMPCILQDLSTPAARKEAAEPICHVLYLPDAEVLLPYYFTKAEMKEIISSITLD